MVSDEETRAERSRESKPAQRRRPLLRVVK
jgi:hypothetical protein